MRNNVDVLNAQTKLSSDPAITKLTDYRKNNGQGIPSKFLFELGIKLDMKPLNICKGAILFHKFFNEVDAADYDEFIIAASCLYLAGKIKDDPIKIRDVINVSHATMKRNSPILELNEDYWIMRDSIVQAELLITRVLKFDLSTITPHKYLLYYLKTLAEWFGQDEWNKFPIAKLSVAYLQDFHHNSDIIKFKPSHVVICCISLALQVLGINVPLTDETEEGTIWYTVFAKDLTKELLWEIIELIMETYNFETDEE